MSPLSNTRRFIDAPDCLFCKQREVCLPADLTELQIREWAQRIPARRKIAKGKDLFRPGDPLSQLCVIRLGSFKSTVTTEEGREQVTGFHMSGEVLGLDAISSGTHLNRITALEDSELCPLSYSDWSSLCLKHSAIGQHLRVLMSRELLRGQQSLLMLGSMNSTERLASFLLNLSKRFEARGFSRTEFVLRMTRADIGSFLGLKLETVSRALSKFTELNLIEIHQKHVHILNPEGLRSMLRSSSKE